MAKKAKTKTRKIPAKPRKAKKIAEAVPVTVTTPTAPTPPEGVSPGIAEATIAPPATADEPRAGNGVSIKRG